MGGTKRIKRISSFVLIETLAVLILPCGFSNVFYIQYSSLIFVLISFVGLPFVKFLDKHGKEIIILAF